MRPRSFTWRRRWPEWWSNPILPSLRDHELLFILNDANTRMIFVPPIFGRHDYAAMLARVAAQMDSPPEIVVVRDGASLPERDRADSASCPDWNPTRCG